MILEEKVSDKPRQVTKLKTTQDLIELSASFERSKLNKSKKNPPKPSKQTLSGCTYFSIHQTSQTERLLKLWECETLRLKGAVIICCT
jgi:hypothetical protein